MCFGKIIIDFGNKNNELVYSCSVFSVNNQEENIIISDFLVYGGVCDFYFAPVFGVSNYVFSCLNIVTNETTNVPFDFVENCC